MIEQQEASDLLEKQGLPEWLDLVHLSLPTTEFSSIGKPNLAFICSYFSSSIGQPWFVLVGCVPRNDN
ncbi:hypothetical protein ACT691_00205 [Vibrio metschnikovii]